MADAARLVIIGRVQGVGFRVWATREARRRGLRGWVRNRRDGSVEALAIGEGTAIDAFAEACRRGPGMAHVDHVSRVSASDDGSGGFDEAPTV